MDFRAQLHLRAGVQLHGRVVGIVPDFPGVHLQGLGVDRHRARVAGKMPFVQYGPRDESRIRVFFQTVAQGQHQGVRRQLLQPAQVKGIFRPQDATGAVAQVLFGKGPMHLYQRFGTQGFSLLAAVEVGMHRNDFH